MFRIALKRVFLLAVTVACVAPSSFAENATATKSDPTGTFAWERTGRNNIKMMSTLKLMKGDDDKLSGTYVSKRGDTESDPVNLGDVKLDGDKLMFTVTRKRNDREFKSSFEGVVSTDGIKGVTKRTRNGEERETKWLAQRVEDGEAAATDGKKWTTLFDGKSLEGWERVGNEDSKWTVEDGAMTATGPASMLVNTTGPYKNFRYRVECKISDGGNSGLYFRTTRKPGFLDGYEAQIDSTHTDPIRTGSLYGMCHVYKQHVKPDTWFKYDLEVSDDVWRGRKMTRVKISINGNELYEYMDFELTFKEGHFAFQHHDPKSIVHVRKVEVMPLP